MSYINSLKQKAEEFRKRFYLTPQERTELERSQAQDDIKAAKKELRRKEMIAQEVKRNYPSNTDIQVLANTTIKIAQSQQQTLDIVRNQEARLKEAEKLIQSVNAYGIMKTIIADHQRTDNFANDPGVDTFFQDLVARYNKNRKFIITAVIGGLATTVLAVSIATKKIGDAYQSALEQSAPVQVVKVLEERLKNLKSNYTELLDKTNSLEETNSKLSKIIRESNSEITEKLQQEATARQTADTKVENKFQIALSLESQFLRAYTERMQNMQESHLSLKIYDEVTSQATPIREKISSLEGKIKTQDELMYKLASQMSGLKLYVELQDQYTKANTAGISLMSQEVAKLKLGYEKLAISLEEQDERTKKYLKDYDNEIRKAIDSKMDKPLDKWNKLNPFK